MVKFKPVRIELGNSKIAGVGTFAATRFSSGAKVAEGINTADYRHLVPWHDFQSFDPEVQKKVMDFCIGTPKGFIPPEDYDFNGLTVEWFFNHSCDGNLGFDDRGDFVARRTISKGMECTYDYGLAESNPDFSMLCNCGSQNCRKIITGSDWKDPAFRRKNLLYFLPALRSRVPRLQSA